MKNAMGVELTDVFDEAAKQVKSFEPLPHFTGEAWQGGKNWPDEKLGWAQLTAMGGHAGNDRQLLATPRVGGQRSRGTGVAWTYGEAGFDD